MTEKETTPTSVNIDKVMDRLLSAQEELDRAFDFCDEAAKNREVKYKEYCLALDEYKKLPDCRILGVK